MPETLHIVEHAADDPGAPVIVLVHGVLDSSVSFDAVVDELVPDFTVVTYDRRGWGRSRHLDAAETLADHAHDVVTAMGERRATVVAHSYGGAVGLLAASLRPDLVAALAVFEPTVAWAEWWPDQETIQEQAVHVQHHFRAGLEGRPKPTPEERARDQALMAHDLTLVTEPSFGFDEVTVPCIIGRSTHTTPWHVESTGHLARLFAADLVVIDDAGHTAHRTQPKAFADFARRAVALAAGAGAD
jgi:pimeloyl-ACP methyl ester carboxylesterase